MRRTPALLLSFLLVALLSACDKTSSPVAPASPAASAPAAPPPPPPPPPSHDASAARAAALAAGPGTCEEDVVSLRLLPMKNQLGYDRHFDRMVVHPQAYSACLVAMVRDRTAIEDPGQGPKRSPYDRGALAYDLLAQLGHIEYGECIPGDVMRQVDTAGARVVYEWLDDRNHRRQAHRCLAKSLGL